MSLQNLFLILTSDPHLMIKCGFSKFSKSTVTAVWKGDFSEREVLIQLYPFLARFTSAL